MKCEICGEEYTYSCVHCTRRIMTWGEDGLIYIIGMSKRKDNIRSEELLGVVNKYYIGKSKTPSDKVNVLRTSLRLLGYKGKFDGRIHKNGMAYVQIRKREHEAGRRYKLKRDKCYKCGSTKDLYLHHILPISWGGLSTDENCITLCNDCHRKIHKKLAKKLSRERLLKYLEPHKEELAELAKQSIL